MDRLKILLLLFFLLLSGTSNAQIIIALLFGDALNTEKIEFGVTGGLNRSNFNGYKDSEGLNNFNVGLYFHLMLSENSFISTGALLKSNVGATGMPTYTTGDAGFDALFREATLTTKVNVIYLPVMFQQRIQGRIILEGGIQPGIRTRVFDYFDLESNGGNLEFKKNVSDDFTRLDFGFVGGMGYKLKNDLKSMSVGILYYQGIVDVKKTTDAVVNNSSLNIYLRIPIGSGSTDRDNE
jgi:hypothetical protein